MLFTSQEGAKRPTVLAAGARSIEKRQPLAHLIASPSTTPPFIANTLSFKEELEMASMEQIVNLAKHRGFVFSGSEIYGGLANTWYYGPLGIVL